MKQPIGTNLGDGNHQGKCGNCGENTIVEAHSLDSTGACTICDYTSSGTSCTHTYGDDDICDACGHACDHQDKTCTQYDASTHNQTCNECGIGSVGRAPHSGDPCTACGYSSSGTSNCPPHDFASTGLCTKCGGQCPHSINEDGVCEQCGWSCSHPADAREQRYDWRAHWIACTNCETIIEGTEEEHTISTSNTATCTEAGIYKEECDCGYVYESTASATGHNDTNGDGLCDNDGCDEPVSGGSETHQHSPTNVWQYDDNQHWQMCTGCPEKAIEGTHTKLSVSKTPTCAESGYTGFKCEICGWSKTESIEETRQHSDTDGDGKCDNILSTGSECGATVGTTECTSHNDTDGDGYCDNTGCNQFVHTGHSTEYMSVDSNYHREYCNTCRVFFGEYYTHNPAVSTYEEDYHILYCENGCGAVLGTGAHTLVTSSTSACTQVCSATNCGYTKPNHSYTVFVNNITSATCTTDGTALWRCAYCTETTIKTVTAAHNWQTFTIAATCTTAGSTGEECSVCKRQINVTTIPASEHNVTTWTNTNDGQHSGTCTRTGCGQTVKEAHTYNTSNVCTKCGAVKNTTCSHNYQLNTSLSTQTNHYRQCTLCNDITSGTHTFTNGVCTICNYNCVHTYEDKQDETYHWKECSNCGYVTGKDQHEYENGECDCGKEDPNPTCTHDQTEYKTNASYHWQICKSCGIEIEDTRGYHEYLNGICKACEYQCLHPNKTEKRDETYHWEECDDCGTITNKEKHSYTNGECDCGKKEDEQDCTHTEDEWKMNEKEHWKVCKDCGEETEGTREDHTYTNGVCKCGKKENENVETCTHTNTEWNMSNQEHWKVCKDCSEEIEGTRAKHTYVDGKCECGKKEDEKICEHKNREWKSDGDEHWQVCKDCGKEIEGTRAKHTYADGECKNCGIKDPTSSDNKLPNTGGKTIAIVATTLVLLSVIGAIKIKKYKGI